MKHCENFETHLNEYVDGELQGDFRKELEDHLAACPQCRQTEREVRDLLQHARDLPKSIQPERDLWAGIRERIEGKVVKFADARPKRRFHFVRYAMAAAAVVLVVLGASVMNYIQEGEVPTLAENELRELERKSDETKMELLAALRAKANVLEPETVATVEESIAVIEGAVREIRSALVNDPNNQHLENMLVATYEIEVNLLRQAVRLVNKG